MPYTKIRCHFVVATKHRRPLIIREVEEVLYPELREIVYRCGGIPIALNGDPTHVHLFSALKPSIAPSDFIGRVKCNATNFIKKLFPHLNFRWQKGFGLFTVSPHDCQGLIEYIRRQKEHHANGTTRVEYEPIFDDEDDEDEPLSPSPTMTDAEGCEAPLEG